MMQEGDQADSILDMWNWGGLMSYIAMFLYYSLKTFFSTLYMTPDSTW